MRGAVIKPSQIASIKVESGCSGSNGHYFARPIKTDGTHLGNEEKLVRKKTSTCAKMDEGIYLEK